MKEVLRDAGIPCAQSTGASSADEVRAFVEQVGFPVILKPRAAAGAAGTFRAANDAELERAIARAASTRGAPVAVEEFIEGHEGFYDTLCVEGRVVHDFTCHYFPNVLEAMRTRWISPQIVLTNRIDDAELRRGQAAWARRSIRELGIGTSATHMEWFFGPKGLKFSEIGCRPPGVRVWDLYGAANDLDLYVEWARAIVHGRTNARPSRRFSAGMIALRPECDGTITGYDGVEEMQQRYGKWLIDSHFPPPGTPTQPVGSGYMGERVGAREAHRLRRAAQDARRDRRDGQGSRTRVEMRAGFDRTWGARIGRTDRELSCIEALPWMSGP